MTPPRVLRLLAMLAILAPLTVSAESPKADPIRNIIPPGGPLLGVSRGEWGARWWSWALGIPAAQNPILDPDGRFAAIGQSGPVWFLAGNFGGTTERSVTVPPGKHLFFPLLNSCYWAPEDLSFLIPYLESNGYTPEVLATLSDVDILRIASDELIESVVGLTLTIDGRPATDLLAYRAQSEPFSFDLDDLYADFGYPPGERSPAISDGYWIMLRPLPPGRYTLRFTATTRDDFFGEFDLDVTCKLRVAPN